MDQLLSVTEISALYDTKAHQLVLTAQYQGIFIGVKFVRTPGFVGGLRFSLLGIFAGPFSPPPTGTVTTKIPIILPIPHFNNKTVLVDTADGLKTVEIKYTGLKGEILAAGIDFTTDLKVATAPILSDVLTPINEYLPGDANLTISVAIPKVEGDSKVSIDPSFNEEFLSLVNATVENGFITYTFRWAKLPTEDGQNPQLINITTSIWNGLVGPLAKTSRNVQGYIVHFVLLKQ
ncbi:hypothetical protein EsH8_X_000360 [Colletotrichum jinshuiense]